MVSRRLVRKSDEELLSELSCSCLPLEGACALLAEVEALVARVIRPAGETTEMLPPLPPVVALGGGREVLVEPPRTLTHCTRPRVAEDLVEDPEVLADPGHVPCSVHFTHDAAPKSAL